MARTGRRVTVFLAAVVALVPLGPGAGGSSGAQQDAGKPSSTLRSYAPYETAEPLPWVTSVRDTVEGPYRYSVRPPDDPPPGAEDRKERAARGSGPAPGLVPVDSHSLKGGAELRFASAPQAGDDWAGKAVTIRGRVGEYASVDMEDVGSAGRVRVELPPGMSFAPLSREEREGTASEEFFCGRDDRDGRLYCDMGHNFITLRVRIDRRVEGAEGRLSVGEPPRGDPDPTNNTAPIKLEITGTAPPGEIDPPPASPPRPASPGPAPGTRWP